MTVSSETWRLEYAGNSVTTAFTTPQFLANADIKAYLVDDSDGSSTTWALTTNFTLTGAGSASGTLTALVAPATDFTLVIVSDPPATQAVDYVENDPFPAASHEGALDKLTLIVRRLAGRITRSLQLADSDTTGASTTLPVPAALEVFRWNAAGTAVETFAPGDVALAVPGDDSVTTVKIVDAAVTRAKISAGISAGICASISEYGAVGDGVADDSAAINAAIYAVYLAGGGNVYFPPGTYLISNTLYPRTGVNWIGASAVSYNADAANATVLKRHTGLLKMIYQSAYKWGASGIEFEGNGGETNGSATYCFARTPAGVSLPSDDPLYPGDYPVGAGCYLYRCTFSNFWYAIGDGTSILSFNISECMFRSCRSAILNVSDSRILDSTFTGNSYAGMNLNNGAVRISGNLFEFNRTGAGLDEAAHGVVLQSNSNEIQIDNNRFDRNAGNDVQIFDGAKRPRDITLTDNHFMRAAWGTNATNRAAVYLDGADRVTITGNQFYAANANPSLSRGLVSPRYAIMHSGCTGLLIKDNQWNNLASKLDLTSSVAGSGNAQGVAPVWIASASGTDEWYLTDYYDAAGNPWIGEPDSVVSDGVMQVAGTAGSLASGEWDWADNDSLGFSTLYCRVTAGGNPGNTPTVTVAYHDKDPVVSHLNDSSMTTRSTDIQMDHFKDAVRYAPAGRVLVLNNAVAVIATNVLSITVADGHGLVAGDTVYLNDAVTVSVPAGLYEIASVTDAGGGNDYININRTAANATGTVDIYTVSSSTFVLRTRRRGMTNHVLKEILRLSCDQATTLAKAYVEMPFFVTRTNTSTLPTITKGTAVTSVGSLSVDWRSGSSDNNVSVALTSDIMGDEITVSIFNTTAYSVEITAEFPW